MQKNKENSAFLNERVNPILERLVVDLLVDKPANIGSYMHEWVEDQKSKNPSFFLGNPNAPSKLEDDASDSEEFDSEGEDYVIHVPVNKNKGHRTSVSAEVYGKFNKKEDFKPRVIPKTQDIVETISNRLSNAFMFSALDDREKEVVINAMEEKNFKAGGQVICQYEDGDELYVVEKGELDCFKKFSKDEDEKYLKTYVPGESFGELALLYNAPRAASIKAKTDSTCWALDRGTFNNIVKDAAVKKREKYDAFLKKVELLQNLDEYERSKIGDGLVTIRYNAGEYVIKQGDEGDEFFFVEQGELEAEKVFEEGKLPEKVYEYSNGDYFGELALLKNVPRQASIKCKTQCLLAKLDRNGFKRLFGNLEDLLNRNTQRYKNK